MTKTRYQIHFGGKPQARAQEQRTALKFICILLVTRLSTKFSTQISFLITYCTFDASTLVEEASVGSTGHGEEIHMNHPMADHYLDP